MRDSDINIWLVHPEDMPSIKNRAVYQRPYYFAKHYHLNILTTRSATICPEIYERSEVTRLPGAFNIKLFRIFLWKFFVFMWLLKNVIGGHTKKAVIYVYPQWGYLLLFLAKLLGYTVVADMQHTPRYYLDWTHVHRIELGYIKQIYFYTRGLINHLFARLALPKIDCAVAMSHDINEGFASILNTEYRVPIENIVSVPNGVEIPDQVAYERGNSSTFKFCFAGNIQPPKLKSIVNLIDDIRKVYPCELHIAGRIMGQYQSDWEACISYDMRSIVNFHGHVSHDRLLDIYKECDFGLFLIDFDFIDHLYSHPGKVLEYMVYGCIPIVSDTPSLRHVIKDGHSGITLSRDLGGLDKIISVMSSIDRMNKIRANAYHDVQKFNWTNLHAKWISLMQKKALFCM